MSPITAAVASSRSCRGIDNGDWRNADYTHTARLGCAQWAWEFPRRQSRLPHRLAVVLAKLAGAGGRLRRDTATCLRRWKHDPRAFRQETDTAGACVVDDDKVLIECWMGAEWEFYKFPVDPAREAASVGEDLVWRDAPHRVCAQRPETNKFLPSISPARSRSNSNRRAWRSSPCSRVQARGRRAGDGGDHGEAVDIGAAPLDAEDVSTPLTEMKTRSAWVMPPSLMRSHTPARRRLS
jgi:hypothetical protein